MSYSKEATGFVKFVDGKWVPTYITSMVGAKTIDIGGNSPMPVYLYAALVTDLDSYMREPLVEELWKNFPYSMYSQEKGLSGKDLR